MAYATPAQMLQLFDSRILGDLVQDVGQRVNPTNLLADTNLALALSTAAGQINSAALIGQRYTVLEMQALTGDDAAFLTSINAWLAFGILCARRGRDPKEHPEYEKALEMLEMLRKGESILNVPGDVSVGTAQINFPSWQSYVNVNSLRTRTPKYYPQRPLQSPAT